MTLPFCRHASFKPHWLFEVSRFLDKAVADCAAKLKVVIASDKQEKQKRRLRVRPLQPTLQVHRACSRQGELA